MTEQEIKVSNIQTYIIVWDVNLHITTSIIHTIDILTPFLCLKECLNTSNDHFRLHVDTAKNEIQISSNLSSLSELKECTTYIIDPLRAIVLGEFQGFEKFHLYHDIWRNQIRFVFKLNIQCNASDVPPIIWKHCTTDLKPSISPKPILMNMESERAYHSVLNNQNDSCIVKKRPHIKKGHIVHIAPEDTTSKNWNLLTVMLRIEKNNFSKWHYLHTTSCTGWRGRIFYKNSRFTIFEIRELTTLLKNMTDSDIDIVSNIIFQDAIIDNNALHHLNMSSSSIHLEHFDIKKFCDISVNVKGQRILAQKIVLVNGSSVWRDLFDKDEQISQIDIENFDFETIKLLIEYIYNCAAHQPMLVEQQPTTVEANEQVVNAAEIYGVPGFKELYEKQLIDTIELKTAADLLVLADRYNLVGLCEMVTAWIQDNKDAFKELEESRTFFKTYPDLAFQLFARIV